MNNTVAVALDEYIRKHELVVVTEVRPDFLPYATLVQSDGKRALLYSREGLTPLARYGEGPGSVTLGELFDLLTGYIRSLLSARDMLLDTRLLSSDPERGVFAVRDSASGVRVKAVWGADNVTDENEKICRVAFALAGHDRVMGARTSMERMIIIIRSEELSLLNCLKAAESVRREWNNVVRAV